MKKLILILAMMFIATSVKASSSGFATGMAMSAAMMAATSADAAQRSSASQSMVNVPADGMVVCKRPEADKCRIEREGCGNGYYDLSFSEFARAKVGHDIDVVSLSYNAYKNDMYVYFKRR